VIIDHVILLPYLHPDIQNEKLMNRIEKLNQANTPARRKFVVGIGLLSVFTLVSGIFKFPFSGKKKAPVCKPETKNKTIKMLTQDGRLVEVDEALLTANRKQVTDSELQNWIKK